MALPHKSGVPADFAELIDECSALVAASGVVDPARANDLAEPLPSLLEQCRALTRQAADPAEPIRLLHHFACTGGTLITRCLASMPNTQVLSEVAPHSRLDWLQHTGFAPTDLIRLLRGSSRGSTTELDSRVFLAGFRPVYEDCGRRGLRLLLREHAHSKYCNY